MPRGTNDSINIEGITYYSNLVDELHKNGIEPQVGSETHSVLLFITSIFLQDVYEKWNKRVSGFLGRTFSHCTIYAGVFRI